MSASVPSPTPDYFTRKVSVGRVRPGPSPNAPHTPLFNRSISGSFYGSPEGSFRNDEENNVVIDLGARFLRIGVAGEATPRCIFDFDPNDQRRVGDYRQYMPDYRRNRKRKRGSGWSDDWQLYSNDVRTLDLGLVGDKLERACRKADAEILMLDERKRRLTMTVSSLLPRPVLGIVLETLFNVFQAPSINILPTSVASLVGSGLRTAIELDIGWSETVVTVISEYREILQRRSIRAGKLLTEETRDMLESLSTDPTSHAASVSFEDAQEVLTRLSWCRDSDGSQKQEDMDQVADIEVPLMSNPTKPISIPFQKLSEPAEALFFSTTEPSSIPDTDDTSLSQLLFNALLALPIDVRKICISRIIITGGSSRIPGLKSRIFSELKQLISKRGWDPVRKYGRVTPKRHIHAVLQERSGSPNSPETSSEGTPVASRSSTPTPNNQSNGIPNGDSARPENDARDEDIPQSEDTLMNPSISSVPVPQSTPLLSAGQRPQEPDAILDKIQAHHKKHGPAEPIEGQVRLVESLGAWAGASLIASLRIKGVAEIDRDTFMKDGLSGAQGMLVKENDGDRKKDARKSLGGAKAIAEKGFNLGLWT